MDVVKLRSDGEGELLGLTVDTVIIVLVKISNNHVLGSARISSSGGCSIMELQC